MTTLFLIGRILFGGFFFLSGFSHFKNLSGSTGYAQSKGVPMPKISVIVTGIMLLLGGASIIFDSYIKFGLLLVMIFLIPTTFMMHKFWKATDPMHKMNEMIAFQKNLALLGSALIMFVIL